MLMLAQIALAVATTWLARQHRARLAAAAKNQRVTVTATHLRMLAAMLDAGSPDARNLIAAGQLDQAVALAASRIAD